MSNITHKPAKSGHKCGFMLVEVVNRAIYWLGEAFERCITAVVGFSPFDIVYLKA